VADKREKQVLSEMKRIYNRVRYLGEKRELRKCERSSRRIQKRILARYGRCKKTRKRSENV